MIDVLLLGAARIRKPGSLPTVTRLPPKPLALLAYLVVAETRGLHRRDKLVALLWPECDQPRARCALRQALAVLRECLGPDALQAGGLEEIGASEAHLRVDVHAFRAAAEAGRWDEAIHFFGGPLVDGLQIPQANDFMDWLDQARARLLRTYERCLEGVALRGEQRGQWTDALEWWCRLADLEPLNVRVAAALVRCQAAGGDPAGALRRAEDCARNVREESGIDPAPELESAFATGCRVWRERRRPA
jgi:serine/threonine-protein kinase